jgi:hypothetical protein
MSYDSTQDVLNHKDAVEDLLTDVSACLEFRARNHDDSKFCSPEKEMFDQWVPELQQRTFGSPEYKQALQEMGPALQHHYQMNRHHPEHFEEGINEMNLLDLIEMVCDWVASATARGNQVCITYQCQRFGIDEQLANILQNTIWCLTHEDILIEEKPE